MYLCKVLTYYFYFRIFCILKKVISFNILILFQNFLKFKKSYIKNTKKNDKYGIRTHEAYAVDLESTPFDRSGTPASCYFMYYNITFFLSILY